MKNKKGFTLIELLIVVAIIGIIAAIAIPNLLRALQKGKQTRTIGDMKTLMTSISTYQQSTKGQILCAGANAADLYNDPAFSAIGKSPITSDGWGNTLYYTYDRTTGYYSIGSGGRDGSAATAWGTVAGEYEVIYMTDFDNDIYCTSGQYSYGPVTK